MAGPGQAALFTGEYNLSTTDVTLPGYTGTLSLGRSHSTYGNTPASAIPAAQAVFGPGWSADLQGPDGGNGALTVIDSSTLDGTISFLNGEGSAMVFAPPGGARRTTTAVAPSATLTAGAWVALDDGTILAGTKLTVVGSGAATVLTLTDADGTVTTYTPTTAPGVSGVAGVFVPANVTEPGGLKTTYTYSGGLVTRILAPIPTGMAPTSCPDGPVTGLAPGCRALRVAYGTGSPGSSANPTGQVAQVNLEIYTPAAMTVTACDGTTTTAPAGMVSVPVACYVYDPTSKRLTKASDPRSGLATSYGYSPSNEVTTVTPPGQPAYTMVYT